MKNTSLARWIGALTLAFVLGGLVLQFGSARAQYGYDPSLSGYAGVSATMIERGGFLYIVQGGTLYKVRAKDMVVVGRTMLQSAATIYPTATPNWGMGTPTAAPTPTNTMPPTIMGTLSGQNGNQ